jgi:hypothetical protein
VPTSESTFRTSRCSSFGGGGRLILGVSNGSRPSVREDHRRISVDLLEERPNGGSRQSEIVQMKARNGDPASVASIRNTSGRT